jgi:hypothetical protein
MALWIEQKHGARGQAYIGEQIARVAAAGEPDGVAMWCQLAQRLRALIGDPRDSAKQAPEDQLRQPH